MGRMSESLINLAMIAGCNYSGSTLLEMMLSRHSEAFGAGEFARFRLFLDEAEPWTPTPEHPERSCACGAASLLRCAFWSRAMERARELYPHFNPHFERDPRRLTRHEEALLKACQSLTGARVLIDSSKSPDHLRRCLGSSAARVHVIHLTKDLREYSASFQRRNPNRLLAYGTWIRRNARTERLGRKAASYFPLSYADLASNPQAVMSELYARLDLPYEDSFLRYWEGERHSIGGNRMRRAPQPIQYRPTRAGGLTDRLLYGTVGWAFNRCLLPPRRHV